MKQERHDVFNQLVGDRLGLSHCTFAVRADHRSHGEQLSFGNRGVGALITALLFAVGFAA
jgi:hypothetical protein